ncbi:MAG TPA: hypothetical protein VLC28_00425 [Flavitalea sp.]|nr:hypothetical protein [Flavitalea sp.]
MRKNYLVGLVVLLVLISCKDQSQEKQVLPGPTGDSEVTEKVDTMLSPDAISYFEENGFSTLAKTKNPNFNWNSFHLVNVWKEDTLYTTPFQANAEYFQSYGPFIKYSSDSTMFIDLDSYNVRIRKLNDGTYVGEELGPDTEVSLVDLQDNLKKRLIFLGPGGDIEDGGWLDSQTIVLAGTQAGSDGTSTVPVIFKYHIPTRTFFLYETQDTVNATAIMREWRNQRLKNVALR